MDRVYLDDRPDVYLVVEPFSGDGSGQVRLVVYEQPDGAPYASALAARFGVPVQRGDGRQSH